MEGGKRPDSFIYGVRPGLDVGNPPLNGAGKEFQTYDFVSHALKTTLKIPHGHAVLAKDLQANIASQRLGGAPPGNTPCPPQLMLIVSARVNEPIVKAQ